MADRDYRWRDERSYRRPGGERDFYNRDVLAEDDYGMGYGEEGLTNYRLRSTRGLGPGGYGARYSGYGDRDVSGGAYGRDYPSRDYERRQGRGLSDDFSRDFSSDNEYGSRQFYGRSGRDLSRARRDWDDDRRWSRGPDEERGFWDRAGDEVASWFGDDDAQRRRNLDARHEGRGPKGYRRSDERIREDVSDKLTDDAFIDASDIEIEVSGSEVTLSGTVDSRLARRRAEDLAERCSGVTHVQNNLRVASGSDQTREEREAAKRGVFSKS